MQLRIALPQALTETVGVFVDERDGRLTERSLAEVVAVWMATKLDDPLRRALLQCLDSPACSIELVEPSAFAPLPPGALRLAGDEERRRYQNATRAVAIRAFHRFAFPLLGVLFGRAVSQAIVEATGGVALEPVVPRLRPLSFRRPHPSDGSVVIAQFVDVIEVPESDSESTLRTAGMARFGLPDFVVEHVSSRNAMALRWLLLGIGQRFLMEGLSCHEAGIDAIRSLDEIVIDGDDVALAFGKHRPAIPPEVATRFSWVCDGLIAISAPRELGDHHAWLDAVPHLLFGFRRSACA